MVWVRTGRNAWCDGSAHSEISRQRRKSRFYSCAERGGGSSSLHPNNGHGLSVGSDAAIAAVPQRPEREGLDDPIKLAEMTAALQNSESGKLLPIRCASRAVAPEGQLRLQLAPFLRTSRRIRIVCKEQKV